MDDSSRQAARAAASSSAKKEAETSGQRRAPDPRLFENTAGFRLAEKILDRNKVLDPELNRKPPRSVVMKEHLDHEHRDKKPIVWMFVGVTIALILMSTYTFEHFHELPIIPIGLTALGIIMAACVILTDAPVGCDCAVQKLLIKSGVAVIGQITEKHAVKLKGDREQFQLDYAFQLENSDESHWGRMDVTLEQFSAHDEGEDLTVLYIRSRGKLISRLYRCCAFRAGQSGADGA